MATGLFVERPLEDTEEGRRGQKRAEEGSLFEMQKKQKRTFLRFKSTFSLFVSLHLVDDCIVVGYMKFLCLWHGKPRILQQLAAAGSLAVGTAAKVESVQKATGSQWKKSSLCFLILHTGNPLLDRRFEILNGKGPEKVRGSKAGFSSRTSLPSLCSDLVSILLCMGH